MDLVALAGIFSKTFVVALVVIDPIGLVPAFLALTEGLKAPAIRQIALRGSLLAALVLVLFSLFGENLLARLGISFPAFQTAGGLLLFVMALEMLFQRRENRRLATVDNLLEEPFPADIAVFPVAIPLIAGPGALTSLLLITRESADSDERLAVMAAFVAVCLLSGVMMALAPVLGRIIGRTFSQIISRLLGLILAALSMQFVATGLRALFGLG